MAQSKQICTLSDEDHPVFRRGPGTIVEIQPDMILVAQAANGVEAIAEFSSASAEHDPHGPTASGHEWDGHFFQLPRAF